MWLLRSLLALSCACAPALVLGRVAPLPAAAPLRGSLPLPLPQTPAVSGVAMTSSHKWTLSPHKDQLQLAPLQQETVAIPDDAAQAAVEDAEEAESTTEVEDDLQIVVYSFINTPDRPCPSGQYHDSQGICRDAW